MHLWMRPYHSVLDDFTIKDILKIEGVKESLQWKDTKVIRKYEVIVIEVNYAGL